MATTSTARRVVHYDSLDDFRSDADRLARSDVRTVGKWTHAQILDHLAKTLTASLDGFGFKAPWFARVFLAPLAKNSFLTKTMRAGFRLPSSAKAILPDNDVTVPQALGKLHKALERYEQEPQRAPHPFLGMLTGREYTLLHLRHSELHMSFVVPNETG
jgi:hypothetical protein